MEFRVRWQQCPHVQNPSRVLFVEADDAQQAEAVVKDHVERTCGIAWFTIYPPEPYVKPAGGRILP